MTTEEEDILWVRLSSIVHAAFPLPHWDIADAGLTSALSPCNTEVQGGTADHVQARRKPGIVVLSLQAHWRSILLLWVTAMGVVWHEHQHRSSSARDNCGFAPSLADPGSYTASRSMAWMQWVERPALTRPLSWPVHLRTVSGLLADFRLL